MSKIVKDLVTQDITKRLEGVSDCLLVNIVGMEANNTVALRKRLREKGIRVMVVKNSLARRAAAGTSLEHAFDGIGGSNAVVWGAEDFVSLAKEVEELNKDTDDFDKFETTGGVMDGEQLTPERVTEISKWPSRAEQLSLLVGQILGPGSQLVAQLTGPGSTLASQVKEVEEKAE